MCTSIGNCIVIYFMSLNSVSQPMGWFLDREIIYMGAIEDP